MKTWLILIYLAISVTSSFSQKVAYDRTNEAGTPLPVQDAAIEEPEPGRTIATHSKDSEKGMLTWVWSFVKKKPEGTEDPEHQRTVDTKSKKGMLARLWSFMSKKVAYDRTNEAGTPLPVQDAAIEEPEPGSTITTHSKDSEKGMLTWVWNFVKKKPERTEDPEHQRAVDTKSKKGMLARLWSFLSKDTSDDKNMKTEPSEDPGTKESEHRKDIKWDALTPNITEMNLLKFRVLQDSQGMGDDPTNDALKIENISSTGNEKRTEETHPSSPPHNHTFSTHSQDTSAKAKEDGAEEIRKTLAEKEEPNQESHKETTPSTTTGGIQEGDSFTNASNQLSISTDHCPECLSATEPPTRYSTTAEPLTTTEKMTTPSVPPRSNLWATCNHSTPETERKVAAALTEFALNFYKRAIEFEKESNMVFSPISISMILSNLLLGACDETKLRLEKLLSYPEDVTCVHAALKTLQKSEALASASIIFYQPTFTLNDEFRRLSDKFYQSRIKQLTNDSYQDVMDINAWVSKNTDHKIKNLLDDLDPDVQMVLLNAVFLRAKWKTMFRKHTIKEDFYRPGLPPISVPMMTSKKYPVASFVDNSLQAKVGRLQLSHNLSLIIIMPRSLSQNLSEVEKRLNADVLKSVMSKLENMPFRPTIVTLPKFKVASSQDLISIVQRLDYGIFYDANLCGISEDEEVAVTSAQHRAVLEINEEGVEAAAATVISLARTANFFSVQQPFIFMVSKNNEFPVFLGRIHNPEAS